MPSQDKLIKQGIKYTDSLFNEISKRLEKGVLTSDTLEAFLDKTKEYTTNNPMVTSGYEGKMLNIILQETNNHKFSRPAQKELVRVTIEERVGENIRDVGDDIKDSVREIVKDGYNQNLSQEKIAANISSKVSAIKNKRARAIARTEIARTATVSDYIINKEMGATHWYVECRNTACPVCKERWHKYWSQQNDETFTPKDTSAGGKGWIGDKVYSMNDTSMLPPVHPNCRCVPYFVKEGAKGVTIKNKQPVTITNSTKTADNVPKTPIKNELDMSDANNNLLEGTFEKYSDKDEYGRDLDVYKFNNVELAFNKEAPISFEELTNHIKSLPEGFGQAKVSRIYIHEYGMNGIGGVYTPLDGGIIHIYANTNKNVLLNNFNHELSHSVDYVNKYSGLESKYGKIFKRDNRTNEFRKIGITGLDIVTNKFASEYAGRHYLKNVNNTESIQGLAPLSEDFAESAKHYLDPNNHDWFVKNFPNRAEYLEEIFGKVDFKNSGIKRLSEMSSEELTEWKRYEYSYTGKIDVKQQVSSYVTEVKNKIEDAKTNIKNAKDDVEKGTWEYVRDEYTKDLKPLEELLIKLEE